MKAIFACDAQGGIGKNGAIPWSRFSADNTLFRAYTEGAMLLMGRKTFDSLPDKPLGLGRTLQVVTHRPETLPARDDVFAITGHLLDWHDNLTVKEARNLIFIGGASLLSDVHHLIDEIVFMRLTKAYDCDTFVRPWQWFAGSSWNLGAVLPESQNASDPKVGGYYIQQYWRQGRAPSSGWQARLTSVSSTRSTPATRGLSQ